VPASDSPLWPQVVTHYAWNMVSCHDLEGNYLFVTPSCERLLGYAPYELVGHSAYDFFHTEDLAKIERSHDAVCNGDTATIVYRIRKKDGAYTWVESVSRVCEVSDGDSAEKIIYAVTADVSQRVAYELAREKLAELVRKEHGAPQAGDENQSLEQIITMCAWSGRVKFEGEWVSVEDFLLRRFNLRTSHGISPEMHQRLAAQLGMIKSSPYSPDSKPE
jgi:PAS domain S-box-containing protein